MNKMISAVAVCAAAVSSAYAASPAALTSPDRHISVQVNEAAGEALTYTVSRDGQPVLLASELGLQLQDADLASGLTVMSSSKVGTVSDRYQMAVGKRRDISYRANEQTYSVQNAQKQKMDIVFRVSNDGVAFRYIVADPSLPRKKLIQERTTFNLPTTAKAWLQPIAVAQTGWGRTNPSYEEHYQMDIPVGTVSPSPAGWVFPALFKSGENWLAISEAGLWLPSIIT